MKRLSFYTNRTREVVDIEKSYELQEKVGFKDSTEALIMAALEKASQELFRLAMSNSQRNQGKKNCKDTIPAKLAGCKILAWLVKGLESTY